MKQTRLNALARDERLLTYLTQNKAIWQSFGPFSDQVTALQKTVDNRRAALSGQQVQTEGVTAAKGDAHKSAIDATLRIARFAASYALAHHDTDLYAQAARSRTYLLRLPDDQSIAVMRQMLDAIAPKIALLKDYGIRHEELEDAQKKIDDAEALRNAPRSVIDTRVVSGKSLAPEERLARYAIKIMDNAIHFFDYTEPKFVAGYWQAHIIIDEGGRHDDNPPASPQ